MDWKLFEDLCEAHSTLHELAAKFDISEDTLERHVQERYGQTFAEVSKRFRRMMIVSLRRKGVQRALGGSDTMLKHLLNNYGGMAEIHRIQSPEEARQHLSEALGISAADLPPTGEGA